MLSGLVCRCGCSVSCAVFGVWCVLWCGLWCVVCGVWCLVFGVWCLVCGVWCSARAYAQSPWVFQHPRRARPSLLRISRGSAPPPLFACARLLYPRSPIATMRRMGRAATKNLVTTTAVSTPTTQTSSRCSRRRVGAVQLRLRLPLMPSFQLCPMWRRWAGHTPRQWRVSATPPLPHHLARASCEPVHPVACCHFRNP